MYRDQTTPLSSLPHPDPSNRKRHSLPQAQASGYRAACPSATDLFLPVPRAVPALAIGFFLLLLLLQSLSLNIFDFLQLLSCLSHGQSDCSSLQTTHLHFPHSTLQFLAKKVPSPSSNAVDPDECETSNERKIESSQQAPKDSQCLQLIARWSLGHLYKALIILNPAVPEVLCTIAAAPDCTGTSCRILLVGQDTRLVLRSLPHCLSCSTRRDAGRQPQEGK